MGSTLSLARTAAPRQSVTDTTDPEIIRLHAQAENALSAALFELRRLEPTAQSLQAATARAVRAATLLKRAHVCTSLLEG